ncbi:aminoacyl-tRNA deacylase [Patescibacteria group bacterium]
MSAPSVVDQDQLDELGISTSTTSVDEKKSPYENLVTYLSKRKIKYKEFEHKPVKTSEEAARERGTDLKQGAKALVMYADKNPVMLVVSAATKVDFKLFKKAFSVKDLRMATPEEALKLTGIKIGAIHPIGVLFNLPTYIDEKLSENGSVIFNAGEHTKSFEIKYKDLVLATQPNTESFTK